jgi:hypothetical protein
MREHNNNPERYRIRREVLSRKIDRLGDLYDHLASDDPSRDLVLDQIAALNIAYNVEE